MTGVPNSTPPRANSQSHTPTSNASSLTSSTGHVGSAHYSTVSPADFLRPRTTSRPLAPSKSDRHGRPIDRDERAGLSAIRNFLKARACYEVLPLSFRLIELDVSLTVKESLNILVQNAIVSAPLWDSGSSTYAGLLTVTDYLNVVQYYNLHADKLKDVDRLLLSDLREVERVINVKAIETVSTSPEGVLYEALRKMLHSRARRIPLVSYDGETARSYVTSVITQYRILKFIAINVTDTDRLRKSLRVLKIGTYENLCRCSMDTTVLDVIHEMVTRGISSVPVCTPEGILLNVFEAVDVINILKTGEYENLNWTIGTVLAARPSDFHGIFTCSLDDGLDTIFETLRKSRVHRLAVVDDNFNLKGVLSLSDILTYILVDGPEET